ncbi:ATP-binding protein [Tenacibaculum agarivorans]|uniref:ATP-binding protein n=1 Tax=Tenacibaculum agarivorans TaxID=1908389 RepID=UPI00094BADB7|nr:ATP-binding protein [Tenacibaculum agarivorans]
MINKRLLIKNLLSHNDENSFYDKKQKLSLGSKEGKAKFIKHICALSNSNPDNNSYILVGVRDEDNEILGVDFFDDSKIQNLVNAYLIHPPKIQYENIPFPGLPRYKVIGLVTIHPKEKISYLSKFAWKYPRGTVFYRRGSNSIPMLDEVEIPNRNSNQDIVEGIEKNSSNNIQLMLDGVFDFLNKHKEEYRPKYQVFKEQFVLCWAGKKIKVKDEEYYSRVDIELINEQVRLFYSALDEVQIIINKHSFIIIEYIMLGLEKNEIRYPLEKTIIHFKNNGKIEIIKEFLFEPPTYDQTIIDHIYESSNSIINNIENNVPLSVTEHEDVYRLPNNYLICYLNGFLDAKEQLEKAKKYIKNLEDKTTYIKYKDVVRVLRKVKYH